MGFKGLAFTDALSMKGFADFVGIDLNDALLAGNDILLFPGNPVKVIEEVVSPLMKEKLIPHSSPRNAREC